MITWSAHLSTLYRHLPVADRPVAAAAGGARVVETWWVDHLDHHAWCEAIRARGLQLVPELIDRVQPGEPSPNDEDVRDEAVIRASVVCPMIFSHCGSR